MRRIQFLTAATIFGWGIYAVNHSSIDAMSQGALSVILGIVILFFIIMAIPTLPPGHGR